MLPIFGVMQNHAVIMHPLPRPDEMTVVVNEDPTAACVIQTGKEWTIYSNGSAEASTFLGFGLKYRMAILSQLPDSLVIKSLMRLPVESLTQCRCVCKSWYNLVSDPYFICSHLSQQLIDEKGYFVSAYQKDLPLREQYSFRCDETFLEKLKVEAPISESRRAFVLVGCAKGLLLMLNPETSDSDLHLWNPAFQKIKPLPSASATYKKMFHREAIGFAFFSDICDYIVIRVSDVFPDYPGVAEIYSLKTDSWRRIEAPVLRMTVFSSGQLVASFVNSVFYWVLPTYQDNHRTDCILSFDIKCETFKMTGLPVACLQEGHLQGSLEVFKESLYLFAYHVGNGRSLWIMKENGSCGMYWLKIFTFEYQGRWPLGISKNGDVILEDVKRKVSLHDPRNMMSPRKSEIQMGWETILSKLYNYSLSLALLDQRNGGVSRILGKR